jgi:outer membrane protein OmpA-like peptidoglycan-associated protein
MPALLLSAFACYALAQEPAARPAAGNAADDDPAPIANIPASSYWGLRGLSQTVSAEPLGMGRLNIGISGSYFKQDLGGFHKPSKRTDVILSRAALAYGVNDNVDIFFIYPLNYTSETGREFRLFNEIAGGAKFSLFQKSWFELAVQPYAIYGSKDNRITIHEPDSPGYYGYDYFDTRDGIDFVGKVAGSLVFSDQRGTSYKMHFNAGAAYNVYTPDPDGDIDVEIDNLLFLWAAGVQLDPVPFLTIGVELNSRTSDKFPFSSQTPLWITPSIMYRSPFNFGILHGWDFRLSMHNADLGTKPLQEWRAFLDVVLSFDFFASKRAAEARRAKEEAAEKARLASEAERLAAEKESLAEKARQDSIEAAAQMAQRAEADSLRAKAMADSLIQKAKEDSLAHAKLLAEATEKITADSLALLEAKKKLDEEKAKRSEAEKVMLNTGMLLLDAVVFPSGKADLPTNSKAYLSVIAKMLVKYPKLKLEIGGHTDNIGNPNTNLNLSQKRAEAVYLHMVQTEPTLSQMLTARGYGSSLPKANNSTAGGREINRRVELKVMNPEVLKEYNP